MKIFCLPHSVEVALKTLSYITVVFLDIVHFILTPFTWLKFKAHTFIVLLAGAGYVYLHFVKQNESALFITAGTLSVIVLLIVTLKYLRKVLSRVRQTLIRVVYAPVGIYFMLPLTLVHISNNKNCKKLVKCGS